MHQRNPAIQSIPLNPRSDKENSPKSMYFIQPLSGEGFTPCYDRQPPEVGIFTLVFLGKPLAVDEYKRWYDGKLPAVCHRTIPIQHLPPGSQEKLICSKLRNPYIWPHYQFIVRIMSIISINLRQLRNPSFITFCDGIVTVGGRHDLAAFGLKSANDAFKVTLVALNEQYALERGSSFTAKIVAADGRRDKAVVGILMVTEGHLNHFDPLMVEAATIVKRVFDKYGSSIQNLSYNDQSGVAKSLAEDLQAAPISASVTTLGLTAWVAEMKAANTAFINLYDNRTEEKGQKPTTKMLDLRLESIEAFKKLVRSIAAVNELTPSAGLNAYAAEINAQVDQYNRTINSGSEDEDETPPTA